MDIKNLMLHGYMVYQIGSKYALKKIAVPNNTNTLEDPGEFVSFETAIDFANEHLEEQLKQLIWLPTVRYNQGLGIEYKNLNEIHAPDKETALEQAKSVAIQFFEKYFPASKILEVRVRLK